MGAMKIFVGIFLKEVIVDSITILTFEFRVNDQ